MPARTSEELPRLLGLLDSTDVVIGTMIGVGVFLVPASIAREVPSTPLILALWLAGGLISLCGALARGSPERWLDALVHPRTIEAPRWTVRTAATALAAVTASRLMGYEVLP